MNTDEPTNGRPVAAVTGGASGIGLEFVRSWVKSGGRAVVIDRNPSETQRVVAELSDDRVRAITADVTSTHDIELAFKSIGEIEGQLDSVVNCAGMGQIVRTAQVPDDDWDRLQNVHLFGTLRACRSAYPLLKTSGTGSIVNISSIAAQLGIPSRASYSAAKAGIEALTRTLAAEWAPDGIRVNSVAPGYVRTPLVALHERSGELDVSGILHRTPLGRLAEPSEIASAIRFLSSPEASYITGHTLVVDGGMTTSANW